MPQLEYFLRMEECLQEKGYGVSADVDEFPYSLSFRDNDVPFEQLDTDRRACTESIDPVRLEQRVPLTRGQLEQLFDYVNAQVDCMRQAGYPAADPPPLQVFIDSAGAWEPYSDLRERGIDFSAEDLASCQNIPELPDFAR